MAEARLDATLLVPDERHSMMTRLLRLVLMIAIATAGSLLGGCAPKQEDVALKKAGIDQVSTIPWNKPAGWEQSGAAGAYLDPRYSR